MSLGSVRSTWLPEVLEVLDSTSEEVKKEEKKEEKKDKNTGFNADIDQAPSNPSQPNATNNSNTGVEGSGNPDQGPRENRKSSFQPYQSDGNIILTTSDNKEKTDTKDPKKNYRNNDGNKMTMILVGTKSDKVFQSGF